MRKPPAVWPMSSAEVIGGPRPSPLPPPGNKRRKRKRSKSGHLLAPSLSHVPRRSAEERKLSCLLRAPMSGAVRAVFQPAPLHRWTETARDRGLRDQAGTRGLPRSPPRRTGFFARVCSELQDWPRRRSSFWRRETANPWAPAIAAEEDAKREASDHEGLSGFSQSKLCEVQRTAMLANKEQQHWGRHPPPPVFPGECRFISNASQLTKVYRTWQPGKKRRNCGQFGLAHPLIQKHARHCYSFVNPACGKVSVEGRKNLPNATFVVLPPTNTLWTFSPDRVAWT